MITNPDKALADLAMKLAFSIAPQTNNNYAAADTGLTAMLMQCLAQDYGRAADTRSRDITELKALFASIDDQDQTARLGDFINREPESLALTDLEAFHAEALRHLITLQVWAEQTDAVEVNEQIWAFLARHADRHAFDLGT